MKTELKLKILKSNKAVQLLINAGYTPQGVTKNMSKIAIEKNGKIYTFKNYIDAAKSINQTKTAECKKVLQLMDQDFEYTKAVNKILAENPGVNKTDLEKELNIYI